MKKVIIPVLFIIAILSALPTLAQSRVKVNVAVKNAHKWGNGGNHVPGTWTAYIEDEKVYIEFTGEDWNTGRTFQLSELGALPGTNEGTFSMAREAGTITFKGEFAGGKGHGFYKFAEN